MLFCSRFFNCLSSRAVCCSVPFFCIMCIFLVIFHLTFHRCGDFFVSLGSLMVIMCFFWVIFNLFMVIFCLFFTVFNIIFCPYYGIMSLFKVILCPFLVIECHFLVILHLLVVILCLLLVAMLFFSLCCHLV